MTTESASYGSGPGFVLRNTTTPLLSVDRKAPTESRKNLPEVLFVTSFPPRQCGIATYSQDLIDALNNQFENTFACSICALESDTEQHTYEQSPKFILNTDQQNAFVKVASKINTDDNIKLVVIQHEFGFYAEKEKEFKYFFNRISKPVVFVFHTVLPNPNDALRAKVQAMAAAAASIIVMTKSAAAILEKEYGVATCKIAIIPHGTHLVPPLDREKVKAHYQLSDRKVLATFGLLGPGKSIETTLDALPAVVKMHPEVLFLVLGKTHPSLVKQEGEQYRQMLEEKVRALHIEGHVRFVNKYLQLPTLLEYLQVTDVYLFTSKDSNQAVSGTFSYAISSGCPVISTPIPHTKEVLGDDNGIIVDFENPAQLATAIVALLDDEKWRAEISSNSFHEMASTAWQNSAIAHALLFEALTGNAFQLNYKVPAIHLDHLKRMTTDFGMIQFAKISIPDRNSGYTLDDNARALIAMCQHYELFQNEHDLELIDTYLQFIAYCLQDEGSFLNYVNVEKKFTRQNFSENLEDSHGRAIWALGYVISLKEILPIHLSNEAESILQKVLPHVDKIHSTRAMAFMIKGLYYQNKDENLFLIQLFAYRMVQMYKHESTTDWHWFENYLTYGNSLLPEALLCAYLRISNEDYKETAIESFEFLLSKIFVGNSIKVVSNKGWHIKGESAKNVVGGEQPIDVAYTIMALAQFYLVFKKDEYKQKARIAFDWFLGNNHLNRIVYNPGTGGCYDGVEEDSINLNQGAESTLSYLMARLTLEKVSAFDQDRNASSERVPKTESPASLRRRYLAH